jgi:hypothetical protein
MLQDFRARPIPSHVVAASLSRELHAYALTSIRNALHALQALQGRGVVSATPVCDASALARMVDSIDPDQFDDDAPDALQATTTPDRVALEIADRVAGEILDAIERPHA